MTSTSRQDVWAGRRRARLMLAAAVLAGLGVLAAANTHLVYVAFTSQPDCVPHLKSSHGPETGFRAARPSC